MASTNSAGATNLSSEDKLLKFCYQKLTITLSNSDIDISYRLPKDIDISYKLPKSNTSGPRPLLVRLWTPDLYQ